jgi:hypothetical protein
MKRDHVKFIDAPKYDEISVKNLYEKLIGLEGMDKYFPSKYAKGRQCDREYLFNIANTLHPQVIKELFEYAHNHRYNVSGEKQAQESIMISDEWANELKAMPFFSKVSSSI